MSAMNRHDIEAQIIAKAGKDEAFRARLLADPKSVYSEELAKIQPGATLPATLNIQVVEETPTTLYLVLPINPDAAERVLTEEELEAIAGGTIIYGNVTHPHIWSIGPEADPITATPINPLK